MKTYFHWFTHNWCLFLALSHFHLCFICFLSLYPLTANYTTVGFAIKISHRPIHCHYIKISVVCFNFRGHRPDPRVKMCLAWSSDNKKIVIVVIVNILYPNSTFFIPISHTITDSFSYASSNPRNVSRHETKYNNVISTCFRTNVRVYVGL
jgi:hypothetical protein